MTFATRMQEIASNLLSTYGQSVSIERDASSQFNPATGAAVQGAYSSVSATAHLGSYNIQEIDNVNVLQTDVRALVYCTTAPKVGDVLTTAESIKLRVMSVIPQYVQSSVAYYVLQLRV